MHCKSGHWSHPDWLNKLSSNPQQLSMSDHQLSLGKFVLSESVQNKLVLGEFVPGKFVLGEFVPGKFVLGEFVPGKFVLGEFVPDNLYWVSLYQISCTG